MDNMNNMNNQNQDFKQQISETNDHKPGLNTWIAVVIVGIVAGVAIAYAIFTKETLAPSDDVNIASTTETVKTTDSKDTKKEVMVKTEEKVMTPSTGLMSVTVEDQVPGTKVSIAKLDLSEPAWVVTFNSTEDASKPFKIIGAQYFDKGTYTNTSAFVAEGIVAGNTYFVTLYKDDGVTGGMSPAGHIFDSNTDKAFTDKTGAWIIDSFKALSTSSRG